MERRAVRALHTVIGPERLRTVGCLNNLIRLGTWMRGCKRDVVGRMPVLREDDMRELLCNGVYDRHDLVCICNRERPSGAEVVLEIDDQENIGSCVRNHELSLSRSGDSRQVCGFRYTGLMTEDAVGSAVGCARVRVRYAETDQMGVVYHANYLVWFEIGRVELMRQCGLDYRTLEAEEGCRIVVVEATARYKSPARYDDQLRIETRVVKARGPIVRFRYQILRESDEALLCEGETVHVVVGIDMKKRHLPKKYEELLGAAASHTLSEKSDGDETS